MTKNEHMKKKKEAQNTLRIISMHRYIQLSWGIRLIQHKYQPPPRLLLL